MLDNAPPTHRLLSPQLLKLLAVAFGAGLLLFLLVWLNSRRDYDFYKADGSELASNQADALPAPLPPDVARDTGSASGLQAGDSAMQASDATPRRIEPPASPASAPPASTAGAAPSRADATTSQPIPRHAPAPRYPRQALRMRSGGTVRVRVQVAADGSVERLDIAESSGDRHLDRAAMEAVRRWTFQPARHAGQPVAAEVVVPITFNPGP